MNETEATPAPKPKRRLARLVVRGLAGLAFVLAVVPLTAWLWLTSASGGRFLRAKALEAAADAIEGRVELERVTLAGLLRLEIEGVRLFAPGGAEPAVAVDRVVVDVRVAALLAKRLEFSELSLQHPVVRVIPEGETTNLSRALASKRPPEPAKPRKKSSFHLHAPALEITDASYRQEGASPVAVEHLNLHASASGDESRLELRLKADVDTKQPIERHVTAELSATYLDGAIVVPSLVVAAGASKVSLSAEWKDALHASTKLVQATLAAADVNGLVPAAKLASDLSLTGAASLDGSRFEAGFQASAAGGELDLRAGGSLALPGDTSSVTGYSLDARLSKLAADRLVEGLPPALANATLHVKGNGLPPAGRAEVEFSASGSRYQALPIDRAELRATVTGVDQVDVRSLELNVADVALSARGPLDGKSARLSFTLDAPDLAKAGGALSRGLGWKLTPMSGRARIKGATQGTYASPKAHVSIEVPALDYDGQTVQGLSLEGALDRVSPIAGSITNGRITAFHAAGVQGRELSLAGRIDGRTMRLALTGELAEEAPESSFLPLRLGVAATREPAPRPGAELWRLDRCEARALGLELDSQQPAWLETGRGRTEVRRLVVRTLGGTVAIEGSMGPGKALEGAAVLDQVRVEQLPSRLRSNLDVAGAISGKAAVSRREGELWLHTQWTLAQGRYQGLAGVSGQLTADLEGKHLSTSGSFSLPGGARAGWTAKLPASAPAAAVAVSDASPVDVAVSLDGIDLSQAKALAADLPPLEGLATGSLSVKGSWLDPKVEGELRWSDFKGYGVDRVNGRFSFGWASGHANAALAVDRAKSLEAGAQASFDLASADVWAGRLPDWRALPLVSKLELGTLDLGWLAKAGFAPEALQGLLVGRVSMKGSIADPQVDGTIEASRVALSGYRDVGFVLDMKAADAVELRAQARLQNEPLLNAALTLGRSPGALAKLDAEGWLDVPLKLEAGLLPTSWQRLRPGGAPPGESAVEASVAGRWTLTGTAAEPRSQLHAMVDEVRAQGARLGGLVVDLELDAERTTLASSFTSREAGSWKLAGALEGSLGARSLAQLGRARLRQDQPESNPSLGASLSASVPDVMHRPLDLTLVSDAFDLSVLDGLVPGVRGLAGRLTAKVEKHGPADDPAVSGKVQLTGGRAAMSGFGVFDQVRADLEVAWPRVELRDFSGRSGTGSFALKGSVDRLAGGGLGGAWHGSLAALPLVQNYQTRGYLSLTADAPEVTWKDQALSVPKLVLSEGLLRVPDLTSKSVQSLDAHPEIVIDGAREPRKAAEPPKWKANVGIVIPDDFRIDAPLGNSLVLGANLNARVDAALDTDGKGAFDVTGKVRVPRGAIRILQARFDLQPSSVVTLFPRQWNDPTLDVTARHESKGVVVTATFTGTASNMVRNLTSKPEMDESEILYFVATGQRQSKAQSDPFALNRETLDDTLLGLAGSFGSSFARTFLQRYLGRAADLDVLSLDPRGSAKVGTYLWNGRLYLGAQVRPNANTLAGENTAELDAEYRINEHAYGRLRVGDQSRSGLEIMYQDSVPAASQRKGKGGK